MLSDGTFYYTYDREGNQTGKYSDAECTTPVEKRTWDHRNRLTKVEIYSGGSLSKTVEYAYDAMNRMYSRVVAADNTRTIFVHDETNQIVLDFTDDNVGDVTGSDVSARRLWHPGTMDHCLVEEQPAAGNVYYPFVDHLNTVRQVAEYNSTNDTTSIVKQITRNAYGLVLTDSAPSILILPAHTGKYEDPLTKDSYHWMRWYDLATGRWRSVDPISFQAGDVNLYRYVRNGSTIATDPLGLQTTRNSVSLEKTLKDTVENREISISATLTDWGDGYFVIVYKDSAGVPNLIFPDGSSSVEIPASNGRYIEDVQLRWGVQFEASATVDEEPHCYHWVQYAKQGFSVYSPDPQDKFAIKKTSKDWFLDDGKQPPYPGTKNGYPYQKLSADKLTRTMTDSPAETVSVLRSSSSTRLPNGNYKVSVAGSMSDYATAHFSEELSLIGDLEIAKHLPEVKFDKESSFQSYLVRNSDNTPVGYISWGYIMRFGDKYEGVEMQLPAWQDGSDEKVWQPVK